MKTIGTSGARRCRRGCCSSFSSRSRPPGPVRHEDGELQVLHAVPEEPRLVVGELEALKRSSVLRYSRETTDDTMIGHDEAAGDLDAVGLFDHVGRRRVEEDDQ